MFQTCSLLNGEKEHVEPVNRLQVKVNFKSSPMPALSDVMTITEVARRSGVASSALRFYESRGLIASERAGSGHRRYPRAVLRRIAFIVFAQKIGLSLDEIAAELAKLPQNRVPERADWAKLSSGWTRRVSERIAELERLKAGLTQCIGCGCLTLQQCQLANPGDSARRAGPGPRFWIGRRAAVQSRRRGGARVLRRDHDDT